MTLKEHPCHYNRILPYNSHVILNATCHGPYFSMWNKDMPSDMNYRYILCARKICLQFLLFNRSFLFAPCIFFTIETEWTCGGTYGKFNWTKRVLWEIIETNHQDVVSKSLKLSQMTCIHTTASSRLHTRTENNQPIIIVNIFTAWLASWRCRRS